MTKTMVNSDNPLKFSIRALDYANSILDDKDQNTIGCEFVKQACRRFINDLSREDIYLDNEAARTWCENLEKFTHVKGQWKGKLFKLSEWQIFITVNLFGFKWTHNKKRRFRDAYIEVPRKNGKSFWVAGIGVGMLTWEEEPGAEVYCGATSEDQAWYVFTPAKMICEQTAKLANSYKIQINAKTITILENGSVFRPIIGDPGDGASPSCAITDEYHEHKDSDQVDTMETGMGSREQPLGIKITTAGTDMGGPCYAKRDDIKNILSGSVEDDSIFGIIYTLDDDDEWDSVESLKKANPNYGISVFEDFLIGKLKQARRSAKDQVIYRTKHLNQWVGAKAAWMNMLAYQSCRRKNLKIEDYKGRDCYVAFDLASKLDIATRATIFPAQGDKKAAAFCTHYLPEDVIFENTRYQAWHTDGWLQSTPGNVIDFEYIEEDLKTLAHDHQVLEVPFDPFQATQFSTRMMAEGLNMIEVGATVLNMSEPMKELEALIIKKSILFEYDPVLMWMFGNVVAKLDAKDNIFPRKERYENKIDGVVALIMAMNRILHHKEKQPSIYELGVL